MGVTARRPVLRITPDGIRRRPDALAVEEPLEIRLAVGRSPSPCAPPGNDVELVHGFLLTEGIIASPEDVRVVRYCDGVDADGANTTTSSTSNWPPRCPTRATAGGASSSRRPRAGCAARRRSTRSRCGVGTRCPTTRSRSPRPRWRRCRPLCARASGCFEATGGLHAAGLFTADGVLLALREDVGRHNAVDKVLGWALTAGRIPASDTVLVVSGRASFELAQKAAMAGIPVLAAVSAPSSLAVDLARDRGMTLVGFLRGESMNVYSGEQRIKI
ncbi:formate dehydrogenase accessory sulfurtransferase FdhD [Rhodococcus hoagii]|nr:formate dehydrogenase accessory sulfurtransferase FdhD [Prescottella equi]